MKGLLLNKNKTTWTSKKDSENNWLKKLAMWTVWVHYREGDRERERNAYVSFLDVVNFPFITVAPFILLPGMYKGICFHTVSPTEYIVEL